ncbi:MAG: hypothetical protein EON54_08565 [Alcaligenaceae bacterium]|nr:MAG: hypothetical protein EON54_08565 [Alcaligenaceae bacterium]
MPDLAHLSDDDLLANAHEWRHRALRGEKDARGIARRLEAEGRRRFGAPTMVIAPPANQASPERALWSKSPMTAASAATLESNDRV